MAISREVEPISPCLAEKKLWTAPVLETIPVRAAMGAQAGNKCDKHGSLSHGSGCP